MKPAGHGYNFFTPQFSKNKFAAMPFYCTYGEMRNIPIRNLLFNFYFVYKATEATTQYNTNCRFIAVYIFYKIYCFIYFEHHISTYFNWQR